ncbi:MAG: (Fe-S)-binding protein [Rhodothermia bacterium]|nr:(Fe-S)-binding protein [Rhodothermia bacterium]
MLQSLLFLLVVAVAGFFAFRSFRRIYRNIHFGKPEAINEDAAQRRKNVLLVAFGQKKMFKQWLPAVLHLFIYVAFVITQIELLEIFIDGLTGNHRIFAPYLGGFYTFVIGFIEVLSVLAFVATVTFLARRNLLKIPRFTKPELEGWPRLDANLILFGEIILITGIFCMNGADVVLQKIRPEHYPDTGFLAISGWLGPLLFGGLSEGALVGVERFGWWLHLLTVLAFLNYLPYSKHLHIMLAFPNVYFSCLKPRGEMDNMPVIMNEVKGMMGLVQETENTSEGGDVPEFGAKDVFDLSWKTVLDAYTCTECGRCTEACPANITGKKLSPRKIMMDIRDRAEEIGRNIDTNNTKLISPEKGGEVLTAENYADGKSLFDYISREEIHACTTCNACVEACPVLINPVVPILELRRYEILTEATGPQEWVPMFTSVENSGAVWQMPVSRDAWTQEA